MESAELVPSQERLGRQRLVQSADRMLSAEPTQHPGKVMRRWDCLTHPFKQKQHGFWRRRLDLLRSTGFRHMCPILPADVFLWWL